MIQGFKKALEVFRNASLKVPAYKALLRKEKIHPDSIQTLKDFEKLPIIDKRSYIYKYFLEDLVPSKKIPPMAYASSGSSGKPTFWFRDDASEERGGQAHELIFRNIFQIKKTDPTLVIVCFSMGVWIAGNYTLAACRNIARKGYMITTITPGIEKEDILHILKHTVPNFKNVIIAGYPPFLMDVFQEAQRKHIPLHTNLKILTAGDTFSENWREDVAKLLNIKNSYESLENLYGCAEAGILGFETPPSIFLRKNAEKNKELYKELFGEAENLPGLFQYNPEHVFFEEDNGELLLTVPTAAPLIRYNIHDIGKVFSHNDIQNILKKYRLEEKSKQRDFGQWNMPFVVVKGRTDVAVTFYALNIFPENIKAGVEDRTISRFLSGNFFAYNKTINHSKIQKLYMNFELAPGVKPNKAIIQAIRKTIAEKLIKLNMEFRKLYSILGEKALPFIILKEYGTSHFQQKDIRGILNIKGKKPKMSS